MATPTLTKAPKTKAPTQGGGHVHEPTSQSVPPTFQSHLLGLQRSAGNHAVSQALQPSTAHLPSAETTVPPIVHDVLRSPGQPLDPTTRAFMESRFGYDLSKVRLHTDTPGQDSARAIDAEAYTVGNDIVFATNHNLPNDRASQELLVHELTHVVQQAEGRTPSLVWTKTNQSNQATLEEEASRSSNRLTSDYVDHRDLSERPLHSLRSLRSVQQTFAIQLRRGKESRRLTKRGEREFSAHLDPLDPNVVIFSRPVTVDRAKNYLWKTPPSEPHVITPEPKEPLERRHARFRMEPNIDLALSMQHGLADQYLRSIQRGIIRHRAPALVPLEKQLAATYWLPASVKSRILQMLKAGQFNQDLPQVHPFQGTPPWGRIIVWVGLDFNMRYIQAFQYWPESIEFYEKLFDKYKARLACKAMRAINAKMKSYLEDQKDQKMSPSDAYEKIRVESAEDLLRIATRELSGSVPESTKSFISMIFSIVASRGRRAYIGGPHGRLYSPSPHSIAKGTPPRIPSARPQTGSPVGEGTARRPRGFERGRYRPGRRVRPGTLEGLEPTARPPIRRPRSTGVTRAEQLEGISPRRLGARSASRRRYPRRYPEGRIVLGRKGELVRGTPPREQPTILGPKGEPMRGGPLEERPTLLGPRGELVRGAPRHQLPDVLYGPQGQVIRRPRRVYPDFEPLSAAARSESAVLTQRLSRQLGISIPQDRILHAPWVGRVRNRAGEITSVGTSQGWLRNEERFWAEFRRRWPADYQLLGPRRTVTPQWAKKYGWDQSIVGDKLVHHHIENGPLVVAIPKSFHAKLSGRIHARSTVVGTPKRQ